MQLRDLHRQYEAMKAEMDDALMGVAASGSYILGSQVDELEQQLAVYVGVKHCVTCASGTDALVMSLIACGIGAGDAVFVPDFTFFATAEAVARVGATPVFVDVDKSTYNIDSKDLNEKIQETVEHTDLKPAVVIAVDLFGLPADYESLCLLCKKHGMRLLEDGAQSFGGIMSLAESFANAVRRACGYGDIGTTSFFPAKPLGCYGDGGAVFTDNDEWAALLRSLRVHGKGADKYDNVRIGFNSRLDAIQSAVLKVKLRHFDDELSAVRRVAAHYDQLLDGKVTTPTIPSHFESSYAQYTIQVPHRDNLQQKLREEGIPTAVYYPRTLSRQTAFASLGQTPCAVAEQLTGTVLSLPIHPYLTDEEIERVVSKIIKYANV